MGSRIGWTDEVWNPVTGCTRASAGCDHCYAVRMSYRLENMGREAYGGLTSLNQRGERHFNGVVRCHEDRLDIPWRWRTPKRIFVNSMSDLFHPKVPFDFIDRVMATIAMCPHHSFQVLTKRPDIAHTYFTREGKYITRRGSIQNEVDWWLAERGRLAERKFEWPLPNLILGTSIEDQTAHDRRMNTLLGIPTDQVGLTFVSFEPLLGPITADFLSLPRTVGKGQRPSLERRKLDYAVIGGESGPGFRPCEPAWMESLVDQCDARGVKVFVKQDSGPRPEQQGRISDALWERKAVPEMMQRLSVSEVR